MKIPTFKTTLILTFVILFIFLGSSCSKKTIDPPLVNPEGSTLSGGTDINYPAAETTGYSESALSTEGRLDDTGAAAIGEPKGNLSINKDELEGSEAYKKEHGRSSVGLSPIYFDFDRATINPKMADKMSNNALFLKQHLGSSVLIEGNCDSRGTNEYNLALGERRALNAKVYLVNLGVENHRIRTVGYGEERPLFLEEDEATYAQNRRADFILE